MKSIIEQASSIIKAIEKAWNQAEQPKEFSIKIFEKEERNFFGMTTKPAKVGIFFGDKQTIHEKSAQKFRQEIKECRASFSKPIPKPSDDKPADFSVKNQPRNKSHSVPHPIPEQQMSKKQSVPAVEIPTQQSKNVTARPHNIINKQQQQPTQPKKEKILLPAAIWTEQMISSVHSWLKRTLELMNMGTVQFSSEVSGKSLRLTFSKPLISDVMHEKQLFRSLAHLIMSSLRNHYKQEIKDLKVILFSTSSIAQIERKDSN